jgi:glycosyltransferase involved in cell wall biosynthesis
MRIGIVWPEDLPLARVSIRLDRYAQGFQALGHEVIVIARQAAMENWTWPVHVVPDRAALYDSALWSSLRLDVAILFTWLIEDELVKAVRPHVQRLIAIPDSDGIVGVRVYPWAMLGRMWVWQQSALDRVRAARYWLFQALGLDRRADDRFLTICRLADQMVVFSPGASEHIARFVAYHGEAGLADRISVAPYPVDPTFERADVHQVRKERVVAIGRWDDPQKDVGLLVKGLRALLGSGRSTQVSVIGPYGGVAFRSLLSKYPGNVEYLGRVSQDGIREILARSRCLLSSSRWESGPIVAAEALLCGCTLVAPASIPSFRHFVSQGGGTLFARRSASELAAALATELTAWEHGQRHPESIAAHWRGQFTAPVVCARILDAGQREAGASHASRAECQPCHA